MATSPALSCEESVLIGEKPGTATSLCMYPGASQIRVRAI